MQHKALLVAANLDALQERFSAFVILCAGGAFQQPHNQHDSLQLNAQLNQPNILNSGKQLLR